MNEIGDAASTTTTSEFAGVLISERGKTPSSYSNLTSTTTMKPSAFQYVTLGAEDPRLVIMSSSKLEAAVSIFQIILLLSTANSHKSLSKDLDFEDLPVRSSECPQQAELFPLHLWL